MQIKFFCIFESEVCVSQKHLLKETLYYDNDHGNYRTIPQNVLPVQNSLSTTIDYNTTGKLIAEHQGNV